MGTYAKIVREVKRDAVALYTAAVTAVKLRMALWAYEQEPPAAKKPARDMSPQEALDVLMHLVYMGDISLMEHIRTDAKGKVILPRPGQQVGVRTHMAGVDYYRAASKPPDKHNGSSGSFEVGSFQPTPAFAIVLYRLAQKLNRDFGASRIVWGGIGASHDGTGDCHQNGRCVDFYGATTPVKAYDVLADWGSKPVYTVDGRHRGPWGSSETATYYRLRAPEDDPAYTFFQEVYNFAAHECTDGPGSPTSIGGHSYIVHPDHPDPGPRSRHQEHIHMQVGSTY